MAQSTSSQLGQADRPAPQRVNYYLRHPEVELPSDLQRRIPDRVETLVRQARQQRQEVSQGRSYSAAPSPKSQLSRVESEQSWILNENPNPRLNFDLTGTPRFAGDVNGDGVNDYVYLADAARDERTSQLEDETGKTALFYGGAPGQTEDQLIYRRLVPAGDLNGDGHDDALGVDTGAEEYRVYTGTESSGYQESSVTIDRLERTPRGFSDLDGDGYEDVVIPEGDVREGFRVVYGASTLDEIEVREYYEQSLRTGTAFQLFRGGYNVADLDGDGQSNIVRFTQNRYFQILGFDESRAVQEKQRFSAEAMAGSAESVSLVDVTGTDRREIMARYDTTTYVFSADDGGTYQTPPDSLKKEDLVPVGDLDGDGNHDFHVTDQSGTRYVAYGPDDLTDGLSFDTEIPYAEEVSGSLDYSPYGGLGDVTGDGQADVVLGFNKEGEGNLLVGRRFFSVNQDGTGRMPTDVTFPKGHVYDQIVSTEEIDFNGDGILDIAMARYNLHQVEIVYGGGSLGSNPDVTIRISDTTNVAGLSSGDINGDGFPDLITESVDGDRVDVIYGGPSANATVDHTILAKDLGIRGISSPRSIGDINNDGADDIIATDLAFFGQTLPIFYGGDPPSKTPDATIQYDDLLFGGVTGTSLEDINGDGINDFAVGRPTFDGSNAEGRIEVYFGSDSPSFENSDLTLAPENPDANISRFGSGVVGGDFNGDGVTDIATKPTSTSPENASIKNLNVTIYHGGSDLDTEPDRRLEVPTSAFGPNAAERDSDGDGYMNENYGPLERVPDVDNDGADELTLGSALTNAVLYRPSQRSSPTLVLQAPNQDADLGNYYWYNVAAGDFEDDGTVDLAYVQNEDDNDALSSSRVYRYRVGDESLPPLAPTGLESSVDPQGTVNLSWEAVSTSNLEGYNVYRSSEPFDDLEAAEKRNESPLSDPQFTDVAPPDRGARYVYRVTAVDADGKESGLSNSATIKFPAIVSVRPKNGSAGTPVQIRGSRFSIPAADNTVSFGGVQAKVDSGSTSTLYTTVPAGASGMVDVTVETSEASARAPDVFSALTGGSETFGAVEPSVRGVSRGDIEWGDYDQDGNLDLIATGSKDVPFGRDPHSTNIYRNEGNGTFTSIEADLPDLRRSAADWGDYDEDGDLDLVVAGVDSESFDPRTTVYRNDGDGTFTAVDAGLTPIQRGDVEWGDFDADGDLDLALTGDNTETLGQENVTRLFRNDGDGTFTAVNAGLTNVHKSEVEWGDFDGDGDLDLAVAGLISFDSPSTTIYENQGGGTFQSVNAGLAGATDVDWVDYDGDGDLDLAVASVKNNNGAEVRVYQYDGNGGFTLVDTGTIPGEEAFWGDVTGDGAPDLLVEEGEPTSERFTFYRNDGSGQFTAMNPGLGGLWASDANFDGGLWASDADFGDMDDDGDLDFVVIGRNSFFGPNGQVDQVQTIVYRNEAPVAEQSVTVDTEGTVDFGETGVDLTFFDVGDSSGLVTVKKLDYGFASPVLGDGTTASSYRFLIRVGEGLETDSMAIRVDRGSVGGVNEPDSATIYKRDSAVESFLGKALETSYDTESDELTAPAFAGEFILASSDSDNPLPVELASFDGTVNGEEIQLSWTTAAETNNAGFRIQRRGAAGTEGRRDWTTIGRKQGAGTTSQAQSYRFTDEDLPYEADRLEYRLKQVDTDGSAHFSDPVTVERSVDEVELLGTYPNPASQRATVRYALPEQQDATLRLYDALGRQVQTVVSGTREGRHEQTLDVGTLPSGVYFLRLSAAGQTRMQKLTVVR